MYRRFPKLALALVLAGAPAALAQKNPFLGKWNITGQGAGSNYVYWLEVKDDGGKLSALFLPTVGNSRFPILCVESRARVNQTPTFTVNGLPVLTPTRP